MSRYRPGGFDDYSDEDSFMLDDDYYDDDGDLPGEPCVPYVKSSNVGSNSGGFGVPSNLDKNTEPQINGNRLQQDTWKKPSKPTRPRNHIVRQDIKGTAFNNDKHAQSKENGIQSTNSSHTFAVDDFKLAAMQNKVDVIKACIESGIEVNVMFASGWTSLMYAVNCANPEAVEALLAAGADPNFHKDLYTVLISACASTRNDEASIMKCAQLLIDKGADVNCFDRYHMSPVIYAAKEGRAGLVRKLVECKADINKQDTRGYTALIWAVQLGKLRAVHTLIELGADVNKQTSDGTRAMDFAVMNGRNQIQEMLKKYTDSTKQKLILTEEDVAELEKKQKAETSAAVNTVSYGDLELFLSGLELGKLIPMFQDHHVKFSDLLRMTDVELQKLGITQFGVRKKLLDAIRQTHKKDWENSSLPAVTYNKQVSCAEAIAMVQNIKKHVSYVASTIGYVGDQIKADKKILVTAHEGVGAAQLIVHADEALTSTRLLYEELATLRTHLAEVKDEKDYKPPDLIADLKNYSKENIGRDKTRKLLTKKRITFGITIVGLLIWKRETVLQTSVTLMNNLKAILSTS